MLDNEVFWFGAIVGAIWALTLPFWGPWLMP